MRSLYLLALTLLLTGVAGCAPDDPVQKAEFVPPYITYQVGPRRVYVREFTLVDGTRCVLVATDAITCEWQRPVILVPRPQ
jgi:hypothetical protein